MRKKLYKLIHTVLMVIVTIATLYIGYQYLSVRNKEQVHKRFEQQINYLSDQIINHNLDDKLQERYPEGKIFSNALLALSILELSEVKPDVALINGRTKAVTLLVKNLISEAAKENFSSTLNPPYGAFYLGWTNLTLKRFINSPLFQQVQDKDYFQTLYTKRTLQLITCLDTTTQLIPTYHSSAWYGDNLACLSSLPDSLMLSVHSKWHERQEKTNGLLPHSNDISLLRGSSTALCNLFVSQINRTLFLQQQSVADSLLLNSYGGITLMREYLPDVHEEGDIDSGPLVGPWGSVASIMNKKDVEILQSARAPLA